jgi:hypothetical protein
MRFRRFFFSGLVGHLAFGAPLAAGPFFPVALVCGFGLRLLKVKGLTFRSQQ